MTHAELIEKILDDFRKEWEGDPPKTSSVNAFREGVIFAYNYLLTILKNDDASLYEEEDYSALCYHDKKEIENMMKQQKEGE